MPADRAAAPAALRGRTRGVRAGRAILVLVAAAYVLGLVGLPLANVYGQAFSRGLAAFAAGLGTPEALHAAKLTLLVVGIAVPANTVFGVAAAWVVARGSGLAARLVRVAVDLPLGFSPTVVGLLVVLAWSPNLGLLGGPAAAAGARILFAWPGLVLATVLVTMPYVAREVLPALYQLDRAEEEAAFVLGATRWQAFRRVVFPAIRASVLYGVVLCTARAAGEFGAVSVVSGKLIGETNTLTLHVERAYAEYETVPAFAAATLLTTVGVLTVVVDALWRRRRHA